MPRRAKKASNNVGAAADSDAESQLTCDGCTDSITKEEALNCSICKVWLHCYCAGVPRSRFVNVSSTFVCIPCSLSCNNAVATELRSEIAALKAEIVELRTALDSANKKLASFSQIHRARGKPKQRSGRRLSNEMQSRNEGETATRTPNRRARARAQSSPTSPLLLVTVQDPDLEPNRSRKQSRELAGPIVFGEHTGAVLLKLSTVQSLSSVESPQTV